jgi:hypothetical protein
MSTSVLLARPHTFIVSEMKPFLEEAGFKVIKAEKPADLTDLSRACAGAVISLAVSSSMDASPEDVVKRLREANAKMPLLFAALLPYAKIKDSLDRVGRQAGLTAKALGLEDGGVHRAELGSASALLYLSKDDLANAITRQQALQAVRRHFGLR